MIREGRIAIPFQYAAGQAGSRFLEALRDDRAILGARCETCDAVRVPARAFCATCGAEDLPFVEVGPEGTLTAWTAVPERGVFGLIRLDGADTALLHRILADDARLAAGTRLRGRFAAERTGSILDIEGFAPVEEAQP